MTGPEGLRVAIVTESFLPTVNGVTTTVRRVLEYLAERGHTALVVCPGPAPARFAGARVVTVPAVCYREFPVGLPTGVLHRSLAHFGADVVHLASPFVLGAAGIAAAVRLGVPSVAVFQTDVPGYARRNHLRLLAPSAWRWIRRMHRQVDITLAPSTSVVADLEAAGVPRVRIWGRGVDTVHFTPERRTGEGVRSLRSRLAPHGELLVGYVGRLAPEKRVERLAALTGIGGTRLVVAGDGPQRPELTRLLARSDAAFLGQLHGDDLADAFAALDLFVHTGTEETFGQTIQEALASGVPVVAPARGGPLDLVRPETNGLLYPPDDDRAFHAAVARLASDAAARQRMAAAARASVEQRTWTALGDQLVEHYRHAIAARSVPPPPHPRQGEAALQSSPI